LVDPAIVAVFCELFEDMDDSEEWQKMLRQVGFATWPRTADEICRSFIAARTG
jgi:hypothetical protein